MATALTGCVARGRDPAGGSSDPSTFPSLSVETDAPPDGLAVDVSVVRGFDADGPARVRIAVENAGGGERTLLFGAIPPFTSLWGEHRTSDARAVLVPIDQTRKAAVIPETPADGTWRATGDLAVNMTAVQVSVAPGERIERTYAVLAGADSDRLRPGAYRFEADDYAGEGPWGFTVTVTY